GWPVGVVRPLLAAPRPDSATLDSAGRAEAAAQAFRVRRRALRRLPSVCAGRTVIVLDDIVTTGATLAAVTGVLTQVGVPVQAAAVLAGTVRRGRG
ncbi:phosphoribosyltransferase family protein, partial [Micromonospora zhanjiangensis]